MRNMFWVVILVLSILGIQSNVFAQEVDSRGEWIQTSSHEHQWKSAEKSEYRFDLGIGSGITYILPLLYFSFQYRFSSFYRMGLEEKIGGIYWLVSQTIWTHEFDIYRGEVFTFSMRVGVGYWVEYFGKDKNPEYAVHRDRLDGLSIPVGLGFAWRLVDDLTLKMTFDYDDIIAIYEKYNDDYIVRGTGDSKIEYDYKYIPLGSAMLSVVFHL